jgi:hypothetical protein
MPDRLPTRPPRTNWGNLSKNLALCLLVGLLALALFQMMSRQRNPTQEFSYTEFSRQLDQGNVARVEVYDGKRLEGDFKNPVTQDNRTAKSFQVLLPVANSEQFVKRLEDAAFPIPQEAQGRDHCHHHRGAPVDRDPWPLVLPPAAASGRRQPGLRLRKVEGQAPGGRYPQDHLRGCGRGR